MDRAARSLLPVETDGGVHGPERYDPAPPRKAIEHRAVADGQGVELDREHTQPEREDALQGRRRKGVTLRRARSRSGDDPESGRAFPPQGPSRYLKTPYPDLSRASSTTYPTGMICRSSHFVYSANCRVPVRKRPTETSRARPP